MIKNILLIAVTRMGDMLQATPMLEGLKRTYPGSRLTVVIEKSFTEICKGLPGIDELYELDLSYVVRCVHRGKEGIVEGYKYVSDILEDLKARKFDHCINMSSAGYTAMLLKMLDVPGSRGWIADDEGHRLISDPWAMLFAAFVYHSNRDYNAINLVDIVRCTAHVADHPRHLIFNVPPAVEDFPVTFLRETGLDAFTGPLICIQAGASQDKRQWAPRYFAALSKMLIENLGARIVFTGTKSEEPIYHAICEHYSHPAMASAVGKTKLGELGALLRASSLLVTGDTGTMHLAVAVGRPVVALFLASALLFETGPYGTGSIVVQAQIGCGPCNPNFPCARPDCHEQITPELIAKLVDLRLKYQEGTPPPRLTARDVNPQDALVYWSEFDPDGFLQFSLISPPAGKNGNSYEFLHGIRQAYRELWKCELGSVPRTLGPEWEARFSPNDLHPQIAGLTDIRDLAYEGQAAIDRLIGLIANPASPPKLLGETNARISEIDRRIENVGLSYPALGALVRMSIMTRENIRGDSPAQLARDTGEIYRTLARRAVIFGSLCAHFGVTAAQAASTGLVSLPTQGTSRTGIELSAVP